MALVYLQFSHTFDLLLCSLLFWD